MQENVKETIVSLLSTTLLVAFFMYSLSLLSYSL